MKTRVTEVLDYLTEPELLRWIENNSKAKRKAITDAALRIGTGVDKLVRQDVVEGGYLLPEGDESVCNCMTAWEKFKMDYPEFIGSVRETQTELEDEFVIGHPDFIHDNGITDLKTSSSIRPRYWTQTAQYGKMKFGVPEFIAVLRLDKKDSTYEYKIIRDVEYIKYEIKVFDAYLTAYNHNFKNRELIRMQLEEEILK